MKTPAFSIRPATEEDLFKVINIETQVHLSPWDIQHFREEFKKPYSHFSVMTDDETDEVVAGYIVYWIMGDQDGMCEILNIAVDFPHRGQGVAKKLVLHAVSTAVKAGARKIVLDVRKSNMAAIQLYQSLRFSITQVRKSFYSNGEDAYGMTLPLDGPTAEAMLEVDF